MRSLINEAACVWLAQIPRATGSFSVADLALYSPTFDPTDLRTNYVADDGVGVVLSATLAPEASAQAVIFDDGMFHSCTNYGLMIGSDAPFATGRPELAGGSAAGTPVTTTTGSWNGAPEFGYRAVLHTHRRRRRLHAAGASDGDAGRAVGFVGLGDRAA